MEEFEDELGSVKIFSTYIERKRSDKSLWKEVEEDISGIVVDRIHYSEIEDIKCQSESAPPVIEIKVNEAWRKMPLSNSEICRTVFKRFRYHFSTFKQNF